MNIDTKLHEVFANNSLLKELENLIAQNDDGILSVNNINSKSMNQND